MTTEQRQLVEQLRAALEALRDWNYANVAYWPDIPATEQNSQEETQQPEDLSAAIDERARETLKAAADALALPEYRRCSDCAYDIPPDESAYIEGERIRCGKCSDKARAETTATKAAP